MCGAGVCHKKSREQHQLPNKDYAEHFQSH